MYQMTYDEYDGMIDKMSQLHTKTVWPTLEQIDIFEKDPARWLAFCCYIHEFGKEPENNDERYRKKTLLQFINKHLMLVDDAAPNP